MAQKTSRLNLRISEDLLALVDEIRERRGLNTLSDVVREALERYADEEADSWNSGVVKANVPLNNLDDLETLIMAGDATDVSQAINFALNDWIAARKSYHLEERDALRKKVDALIGERGAKGRLRTVARQMSER